MRFLLALLVSAAALLAGNAPNPGLQQVHNVYLLPMSNSMDQYLANQITSSGLFQVVTDPQKADAVITDSIGTNFEDKLEELYPTKPKPKKDDKDKKDEDDRAKPQRIGAFSRGRGNIFIVDRASRSVVWSVYL